MKNNSKTIRAQVWQLAPGLPLARWKFQ